MLEILFWIFFCLGVAFGVATITTICIRATKERFIYLIMLICMAICSFICSVIALIYN